MKKLLVAFIILFYGISASGATVQLHYCCGKLKTIEFGSAAAHDCGMMKEMMGSKPCCETKTVSAKDDQDNHVYSIVFNSVQAPAEPPVFDNPVEQLQPLNLFAGRRTMRSSPPIPEHICILNCVFRI